MSVMVRRSATPQALVLLEERGLLQAGSGNTAGIKMANESNAEVPLHEP